MVERIFPFGATYIVGGDFPPKEDAKKDLKKMKDLGFTVFRTWVSRFSIERKPGIYDFSEVEDFLNVANDVGIRCALTVDTGLPPNITREEIGEGVIGINTKIGKPYPHFQPCFDNPHVRRGTAEYLIALSSHLKNHPALYCWISWNEPHITYSDIACYCDYSVEKFRKWLNSKYGGLEGLNSAWNERFENFSEVYPPNRPLRSWGKYKPWLDWRAFCDDNLAEWVGFVSNALKKGDHNHPTHTNLLFHQILYNQPAVGADTWKMAKVVDTLGVSIYLWTQGGGDFPWCFSQIVDTVRSAAESEGKEAWVTELQGGPTIWAHSKSVTPSPKQIELWAWQTVARGGRGLIYWLWRPRIGNVHSGWENNEFGLVSKDGELRPRAEAAGKACRMITKNADLFLNARPNAKVAILQSQTCKNAAASEIPDETIFHPYEGQRRYYTQSQLGAYKILWEEKIPCDFINPPSIAAGMLNRYKVLIMPFTYMLDEPSANAIKSFVRKGGCVLADFGCAMKDEYGAVHITSPGFGLDEIFGTYSYDIETPDDNEFLKVKVGPETEWPIFEADLPLYAFREILRPYDGAKVIGEFINGEPAVIENRFEKGKTVLVGTLMFQSYLLKGGAWRVFVKELLHSWGVKSAIDIENIPPELWCNIEVGLLEHEDMKTKVIILLNHNREDVDANVKMQDVCSVIDLETGNKLPLEHLDENTYLKTIIKGKSAKVLKAEKY